MVRIKIEYPVKIGFSDGSGKDENYITDNKDNVIVRGWGECCQIGGIKEKRFAKIIVKLLNAHKPIIYFAKNSDTIEKEGEG